MHRRVLLVTLIAFLAGCGGSSSNNEVASVTVSPPSASIAPGGTVQFTAQARDGNGNQLTDTISWTSESPSVASIDASGKATAISAGTATIDATASNGVRGIATLSVTGGTGTRVLSVSLTGSGSGTVTSSPAGISCPGTCSASFPSASGVTLQESPGSGSRFSGWSGACGGTGDCTVNLNSDTSVTAQFDQDIGGPVLTVSLSGNGSGTVTSSPAGINCSNSGQGGACSAQFASDTLVTLEAVPGNNSTFLGWTGGSCSGTGKCSFTLSSSQSISAAFEQGAQGMSLTVNLPGDGLGTVTSDPPGIDCTSGSSAGCTATFPSSTTGVMLTVAPESGSSFAGWSFGGCNGDNYATTCNVPVQTGGSTVSVYFSAWAPYHPFPGSLSGMTASSGGLLLAVGGDGAAVTSPDGSSWTGRPLTTPTSDLLTTPLKGVAYSGAVYVAVGDDGTVLATQDGVTWDHVPSSTSASLTGVAFSGSGGRFVAVGGNGTILACDLPGDGCTGTAPGVVTSSTTQDLLAVTYGGGQFVAVGYGGTILTSPDGVSWTSRVSGTTQFLTAVTFAGGKYVAVGSAGTVLTSPDGTTWTPQKSLGTLALRAVTGSGSIFVATGDYLSSSTQHALAFTSPDGATWSQVDTGLWQEDLLAVAWLEGAFYGMGASGSLVRSTDGSSWSPVLPPASRLPPGQGNSASLSSVAYDGTIFVAVGYYGSIFTSPDGVTWTSRRASAEGDVLTSVTWGDGVFVAVGEHSSDYGSPYNWYTVSSLDGLEWTEEDHASTGYPYCVVYGAGQFVAAGWVSSDPGYTGLILTSPDGSTWTEQKDNGITAYLASIAYGAGQYVVVGQGAVYTSSTGVGAWTPQNPPTPDLIGSVAYGNGTFVGIDSQTGAATFTSPDGVHWTSHAQAFGSVGQGYGNALVFGNGVFLSTALSSSPDGVTWTTTLPGGGYPQGANFSSGVYADGIGWVAVGYGETFMTHP